VGLAQQPWETPWVERIGVGARHAGHGCAQLVGAHRVFATQPPQRVLQCAEGLGEREPAPAWAVFAATPAAPAVAAHRRFR
jgi:hypothetical protein